MSYFVKTPAILRHLFPSIVWKLQAIDTVYITFDDGPYPAITPFVLDTLQEYDAKGTFFCVGQQVEKHPEIFDKIKNNGHSVGNHTYSHFDGWKTQNNQYQKDTEQANTLIKSPLFRPPYGRITPLQKRYLSQNYKIIMWDILSGDFDKDKTPDQIFQNVISNIEEGSIIVFHDSPQAYDKLKIVLPQLLDYLKSLEIKCKAIEPFLKL